MFNPSIIQLSFRCARSSRSTRTQSQSSGRRPTPTTWPGSRPSPLATRSSGRCPWSWIGKLYTGRPMYSRTGFCCLGFGMFHHPAWAVCSYSQWPNVPFFRTYPSYVHSSNCSYENIRRKMRIFVLKRIFVFGPNIRYLPFLRIFGRKLTHFT